MVPEDALRDGRNTVEVLEVAERGRWRCWLAAELAAALLLAGCAGSVTRPAAVTPERRPPVVFVVFDEFPADDLLRPDGQIDAERFPNFARARVDLHLVPEREHGLRLDLQGGAGDPRRPAAAAAGRRPTCAATSRASSTWWTGSATRCSRSSRPPPSARPTSARARARGGPACSSGSPAAGGRRGSTAGSGRSATAQQPTFYFQHALMPHEPWIYLPSGHQSRPRRQRPDRGHEPAAVGFDDPDLTDHNHLRHLLQVGYTDRQIGELLDRLRRTGLLDRALVVVTADHGISFQVGVKSRRLVSDSNVEEIAPVPFFVKAPGQTEGRVDEASCATSTSWRRSRTCSAARLLRAGRALGVLARHAGAPRVRGSGRATSPAWSGSGLPELERAPRARRVALGRLFGTGAESELLYGDPWAWRYRIGPHPELLGRRVPTLGVHREPCQRA